MECPHCGQLLTTSDNFCTCCGTRVRRHPARAAAGHRGAHAAHPHAPEAPAPSFDAEERELEGSPRLSALRPRRQVTSAWEARAVTDRLAAARQPAAGGAYPASAEAQRQPPGCGSVVEPPASSPWEGAVRPAAAWHEPNPSPAGGAARRQPDVGRSARPRRAWASRLALLSGVAAALVGLAAVTVLAVAPVAGLPFFNGVGASSQLVHDVLASVDPALSVFMSGLMGSTAQLSLYDLAMLCARFADVAGGDVLALAGGAVLGLAATSVALVVLGALSTVVARRATPALIAGTLIAALVGGGLYVGAGLANDALLAALRSSTSEAMAALGAQLPATLWLVEPTAWPLVVAVSAAAAFVCACIARGRRSALVEEL